jgi:RNA polymerase sigma factor for flagellar operon FliA
MTAAEQAQQSLVEAHQGLVHSIAGKIHRKVPRHIELDDLIGYGQVGLAQAAQEFDPGRGTAFSTFAYYRIRGAMYDGVSKLSWTSRARYNRLKYEQMANATLEAETDAPGTGKSDAAWLGQAASRLAVVYLAAHARDGGDDHGLGDVADPIAASPSEALALREACDELRKQIDELPAQTATLIRVVYFEGLSLQDAGKRIGITKSWASRLHAKALNQLAQALRRSGCA